MEKEELNSSPTKQTKNRNVLLIQAILYGVFPSFFTGSFSKNGYLAQEFLPFCILRKSNNDDLTIIGVTKRGSSYLCQPIFSDPL